MYFEQSPLLCSFSTNPLIHLGSICWVMQLAKKQDNVLFQLHFVVCKSGFFNLCRSYGDPFVRKLGIVFDKYLLPVCRFFEIM